MNTQHPEVPWLDAKYFENRRNFPPDEVAKHAGRYIAWNGDATRILESAETREELWEKLVASGIDPHRAAFEFVDDL